MLNLFKDQSALVVMRHEKSIASVWGFLSAHGIQPSNFHQFVLERHKDSPEVFLEKKTKIMKCISEDAPSLLVLATKVNDSGSESEIIEFLVELKEAGIQETPIVLTHLSQFDPEMLSAFKDLELNIHYVEDDNLGFPKDTDPVGTNRTGMSKLGTKIQDILTV